MQITIRRAQIEDATGIALVQIESWRSTYSGIVPDAFLASMDRDVRAQSWKIQLADDNVLTFVTEDESGMFGFASGGRLREPVGDYDTELYAIYLLRRGQGHGVGRNLTQTMAHGLRAKGLKSLLVWVLEQNPSAGFYKHLGAIQIARKFIQIGGVDLPEIALGWPNLDGLICDSQSQ